MRLLVVSDIHANLTALEAVLAAVEGRWDRGVCLGDLVGYGPDPDAAIDKLRGLGFASIRGNHDKASCGISDTEDFNPAARMAAEWTERNMKPENLKYLQELPVGPMNVEGVTLVHGALHNEDEYVFAPAQALEGLLESPTELTFFGHTHFQGGFSIKDSKLEVIQLRPPEGAGSAVLQLEKATRYLLNPGSVGQPRDGDARAAFALVDLEHRVVEFWRAPYNVGEVQERMKRAGLPEPLILRLAFGR